MAKKPDDALKEKRPKTPAQILTQLRKDARATMRGLIALDETDALDRLPEDFSLGIYLRQLTRLLYATPPVGRAKEIKNALTVVGKELARKAKHFSPEKMESIRANKIEAEAWERALSGGKLTDKSFAEFYLKWQWEKERGKPPSLIERQTKDYKARLKTLRNHLSEGSPKSQNKK